MSISYYLSKIIKKLHLPAIKNSCVDKTSRVCSGSHLVNVCMGKYSYIGSFCTAIHANIGSFCSIADHCIIGGASHPIEWVSTSPVFHEGKNVMNKNFSRLEYQPYKETIIGNDVWIGSHCLIKGGIVIGDGAIVGMGSVVTKDVEPYSIVAGNPAKLIRKRFSDETIAKLTRIKWWDFEDSELEKIAVHFNDTMEFIIRCDL